MKTINVYLYVVFTHNMSTNIVCVLCSCAIVMSTVSILIIGLNKQNNIISDSCNCHKTNTKQDGDLIRYRYRNQLLNRPFTQSDPELASRFRGLVARKVGALNEDFVALTREVIEPPSEHIQKIRSIPITPQNKAVMEILHKKVRWVYMFVPGGRRVLPCVILMGRYHILYV